MPLGGNWPGSNRSPAEAEFRSSPRLLLALFGLSPLRDATQSRTGLDPASRILGAANRPEFFFGTLKR